MPKVRIIPEDRIKVLEASLVIDRSDLPSNLLQEQIIQTIGQELAAKLYEFHKISIQELNGVKYYITSIEIIVPQTPENHI